MNPRPIFSWGIATSLVVTAALTLLLWAAWQPVSVAPANPAASVMLVFAAQATSPERRQAAAAGARQSAASSAARPPKSTTRQEAVPVRLGARGIAKQFFLGARETDTAIDYVRAVIALARQPVVAPGS